MGCGSSTNTRPGYTVETSPVQGAVSEPELGHEEQPMNDTMLQAEFNEQAQIGSRLEERIGSVIVIGAGVAGLNAADALLSAKVDVTILEAQDRVGGRLYTDENGFDIGGHWIHGGGPDEKHYPKIVESQTNPIRRLCDKYNIQTVLTDGDSTYIGEGRSRDIAFYTPDYKKLSPDRENQLWNVFDRVYCELDKTSTFLQNNPNEPDQPFLDGFKSICDKLELTDEEKMFVCWHAETMFNGDYAFEEENCSMRWWMGGTKGHYRMYPGGDRCLVNGYSELVYCMYQEIERAKVHLNETVSAISRTAHKVTVKTASGKEYTADACLVTVPLGILQRKEGEAGHIRFEPPLPSWKTDAINSIGMGVLNKLFLVFDKCYWPEDQYSFAYINKKKDERASMILNLMVSHKRPVLVFMCGGQSGKQLEQMSEEEAQRWAMPHIRNLFEIEGQKIPEPTKVVMTRWNQDPYSYGAYSIQKFGMPGDAREVLQKPVDDRLFFAGEATSPHFWGCVHGSYVSGLQAAVSITGDATLMDQDLKDATKTKVDHRENFSSERFIRWLLKNESAVEEVFRRIDKDSSGAICMSELSELLSQFRPGISQRDKEAIFQDLDSNNDNSISFEEFKSACSTAVV